MGVAFEPDEAAKDDQIIETELYTMTLRWYFKYELILMLEQAGFRNILSSIAYLLPGGLEPIRSVRCGCGRTRDVAQCRSNLGDDGPVLKPASPSLTPSCGCRNRLYSKSI